MTTKTCTNCPGRTDHSTAECTLFQDQRDRLATLLREIVLASGVELPGDISDELPAGPDLIVLGTEVVDRLHDLNKVERVALEVSKANDQLVAAQASAAPEQEPVLWCDPEGLASEDRWVRASRRQSEVVSQPLYNRPDAEIERLRADWAEESAEHRITQVSRDKWRSNYHEAMQKLAEAQAIMQRVLVKELLSPNCPLHKRIDAFLSAAQPAEVKS